MLDKLIQDQEAKVAHLNQELKQARKRLKALKKANEA